MAPSLEAGGQWGEERTEVLVLMLGWAFINHEVVHNVGGSAHEGAVHTRGRVQTARADLTLQ